MIAMVMTDDDEEGEVSAPAATSSRAQLKQQIANQCRLFRPSLPVAGPVVTDSW